MHFGLYTSAIINLGSERHEHFIQDSLNLKCFGSYAMTELAHGSNVQALETTATYDSSTKEFVFQTPRKEAMKFWIGGIGQTSQRVVVFAQLVTQG